MYDLLRVVFDTKASVFQAKFYSSKSTVYFLSKPIPRLDLDRLCQTQIVVYVVAPYLDRCKFLPKHVLNDSAREMDHSSAFQYQEKHDFGHCS